MKGKYTFTRTPYNTYTRMQHHTQYTTPQNTALRHHSTTTRVSNTLHKLYCSSPVRLTHKDTTLHRTLHTMHYTQRNNAAPNMTTRAQNTPQSHTNTPRSTQSLTTKSSHNLQQMTRIEVILYIFQYKTNINSQSIAHKMTKRSTTHLNVTHHTHCTITQSAAQYSVYTTLKHANTPTSSLRVTLVK